MFIKFKLFSPLILVLFIFTGLCMAGDNAKEEDFKIKKSSKMSDVLSVIVAANTSDGIKNTENQISADKVSLLLKNFFTAMGSQNLMTVSAHVSESFVNDRYSNKKKFMNALKESSKRSKILKLDYEIKKTMSFGMSVKVLVEITEVRIYLKSALMSEKRVKAIVSISKDGNSLKIRRIDYEKELPLLAEKENFYNNNWTHYNLGKFDRYKTFGMDYRGVMEYLTILPEDKPWEMYLSSVHLNQDIPSALWMAKKDIDHLKRLSVVKVSKIKKCNYHRYDCGILEFKTLVDGLAKLEKRIYFYRKPLMYVMGITAAEGDNYVNGQKDFDRLLKSFNYVPLKADLEKMIKPSNLKAGSLFKSNFYGFMLDAPVDWEVYAYRPGTVQFKPLNNSLDALAFVNVAKADDLKTFTDRYQKVLSSFYKYFDSEKIKDADMKNFNGQKYRFKFKKSFFEGYRYKDSLFFKKGPYIYELAFVYKDLNEKESNQEFSKFIKAFKFN